MQFWVHTTTSILLTIRNWVLFYFWWHEPASIAINNVHASNQMRIECVANMTLNKYDTGCEQNQTKWGLLIVFCSFILKCFWKEKKKQQISEYRVAVTQNLFLNSFLVFFLYDFTISGNVHIRLAVRTVLYAFYYS